ncbi:MAG: hypothetical protein WBY94_15680 [Polyangiaceae bacterium]
MASCVTIVASLLSAADAGAAANVVLAPPAPDTDRTPSGVAPGHRTFGMFMDLGVPDGVALGLVVRPAFDWLRIGGAVTHNGMAPGARFGVTLDPVAAPVGPTLTVEGGHYWGGKLPMISDSPSIAYNYANFHLGLEVGNRATFRFFLRGGVSWLDLSTAQSQGPSSGSGIANPSYSGWLAPSGKLGFAAYF